jgi:hypothetical protein
VFRSAGRCSPRRGVWTHERRILTERRARPERPRRGGLHRLGRAQPARRVRTARRQVRGRSRRTWYPEFWPDPAGFDPRRFLPDGGASPFEHDNWQPRHRYAYIPFGGGRRACVGQSFAELETLLVLATIARRYRLELTMSGIPVPTANITLRPGRSLPMRLVNRK